MPFALMVILGAGTLFAVTTTLRNVLVRRLIFMGWTPLLSAMVISSGTGVVLNSVVDRYKDFGLLAIGLGG